MMPFLMVSAVRAPTVKPSSIPSNGAQPEPDYEAFFCLPSDTHNARGFGGKVYSAARRARSSQTLEAGSAVPAFRAGL